MKALKRLREYAPGLAFLLVVVLGLVFAGLMARKSQAQGNPVEQVAVFSGSTSGTLRATVQAEIDMVEAAANDWLVRNRDIVVTGRQANVAVAGGQFANGVAFQTTYVVTLFYHKK